MILIPAKTMKKGREYWTKIGRYMDRVVIVKIVHFIRNSGGAPHGRRRINRVAQLRRIGEKKVLPKLRRVENLWVRQ